MTSDKDLDHSVEIAGEVEVYISLAINSLKLIAISFFTIWLCHDYRNA